MSIELLQKAVNLYNSGDIPGAKQLCLQVLSNAPGNIDAIYLLGSLFLVEGKYQEAKNYLEEVIELDPSHVNALNNYGIICLEYTGELNKAEKLLQKALSISPDNFSALQNLGNLYFRQGDSEKAIVLYTRALDIEPGNMDVLLNLCLLLMKEKKYEKLEGYIPGIISGTTHGFTAVLQLVLTRNLCFWDEAKRITAGVIDDIINGNQRWANYQGINLNLLAIPEISNQSLFKIHKSFAAQAKKAIQGIAYSQYQYHTLKDRKIRIGYISPDFNNHVVSRFIKGIMEQHDRNKFEIYCYYTNSVKDKETERYSKLADIFCFCENLSDLEIAQKIHEDAVDILVDLAGYTFKGRISLFDYRPAPIQITYLGYPFTSGMDSVDYIVMDKWLSNDKSEDYITEKELVLPETYACFDGYDVVQNSFDLAYDKNGYISFGSLINLYKLNQEVVRAWSKILNRVTNSKLIINHPNCEPSYIRKNILDQFARHGIENERIIFVWQRHPQGSHLYYYNDIDIALDTFPMTGGMSTVDCTCMGVPVVTLVGDAFHNRLTYSYLKNLEIPLDELIATDVEEYIDKAVLLAADQQRLRDLKKELSSAVKKSTYYDSQKFTRQLESAYISIWDEKVSKQESRNSKYRDITIADDIKLSVINSLEDVNTYVLSEFGKWYDAEYDFILGYIKPGMNVVDIGANMGVYSLPIAKKLAGSGKIISVVESDDYREIVESSINNNNLLNVEAHTLDGFEENYIDKIPSHTSLNFVRLQFIGLSEKVLNWLDKLIHGSAPLICLSTNYLRDECWVKLSSMLQSSSYELFRYLPELNILVAAEDPEQLDPLTSCLFACHKSLQDELGNKQILVTEMAASDDVTVNENNWLKYFEKTAFTNQQIKSWQDSMQTYKYHDEYLFVLNLFVHAQNNKMPAHQRYAALRHAESIIMSLFTEAPTVSILLTMVRISKALGKRHQASTLLYELLTILENSPITELTEPFLVPSEQFEHEPVSTTLNDWLYACALQEYIRLHVHTSYYYDRESLQLLESVSNLPYHSPDIDKKVQLLKQRFSI